MSTLAARRYELGATLNILRVQAKDAYKRSASNISF
jgi:hypothetical protein